MGERIEWEEIEEIKTRPGLTLTTDEVRRVLAALAAAEAMAEWALYKPLGTYICCRFCGQTWWPDKEPRHYRCLLADFRQHVAPRARP